MSIQKLKAEIISLVNVIDDEATLLHILSFLRSYGNNYPAFNRHESTAAEPTAQYEHLHHTKEEEEEWLKQPDIVYLTDEQKHGVLIGQEDVRIGRVHNHEDVITSAKELMKKLNAR